MHDFGIFTRTDARAKAAGRGLTTAQLNKWECSACPLNRADLAHPKMGPTGPTRARLYALGEAPCAEDDAEGVQFVGAYGQYLRRALRKVFGSGIESKIRWNNVIRDRPPGDRDPTATEIECCRPSIERDLAATKPSVVMAFGRHSAAWFGCKGGIKLWRGRRIPWRGSWVLPMMHPSFVVQELAASSDDYGSIGEAWERIFYRDLAAAKALMRSGEKPVQWTEAELIDGTEYILENDPKRLRRALREMLLDGIDLAVDLETSRLRPYEDGARVLVFAVSSRTRTVCVVGTPEHLAELRTFFETSNARMWCHNLGFEMEWFGVLFGESFIYSGMFDDTMAQAFVLDERQGGMSLNFVVLENLGLPGFKDLSDLDRSKLETYKIEDVARYCALDARATIHAGDVQTARIREQGLVDVYRDQVRRVAPLVTAQIRGVIADQAVVGGMRGDVLAQETAVRAQIVDGDVAAKFRRKFGSRLNPDAPEQVGMAVQEILGVELPRTKKGKVSTKEEHLRGISAPFVKQVLKLRDLTKQRSTYLDPLVMGGPKSVVFPDGRLHTTFNTCRVRTRRTSSDGPNMQNFPKRKHKGIRGAIVPTPGNWLIAADYGQIEARAIGLSSKDERYCKALWDNYDIHLARAKWLIKVFPEFFEQNGRDLKACRGLVKNGNFALFFGSGAKTLARHLDVPIWVAEKYVRVHRKEFSTAIRWQKTLRRKYEELGYIQTQTGFRCRYDIDRGPLAYTEIVNTPIQSVSSDIVVDALCRIAERAQREKWRALQPVLLVHDDLTFDVPDDEVEDLVAVVAEEMLSVPWPWVTVPLSIEVEMGRDWASMEAVGTFTTADL